MPYSNNWLFRKVLFLSVSAVIWLSPACPCRAQAGGPTFPDPGKPGMSRDQQIQLGLQTASQVYQQMPVLPDSSPETQYIRWLGTRLVSTIPPQHTWPFEFHVVAQKEINAFALPGGEMFVNIGTITAAANEARWGRIGVDKIDLRPERGEAVGAQQVVGDRLHHRGSG